MAFTSLKLNVRYEISNLKSSISSGAGGCVAWGYPTSTNQPSSSTSITNTTSVLDAQNGSVAQVIDPSYAYGVQQGFSALETSALNKNRTAQVTYTGFSVRDYAPSKLYISGLGIGVIGGSSQSSEVAITVSIDGGSTYTTIYSFNQPQMTFPPSAPIEYPHPNFSFVNGSRDAQYILPDNQDPTAIRIRFVATAGRVGGEGYISWGKLYLKSTSSTLQCLSYAPTNVSSPATIDFYYTLNGLNGSPTYTSFYSVSSNTIESVEGVASSSTITGSDLDDINTNLENLKIKTIFNCPTGATGATANLKVYDVWADTVVGTGATPPTALLTVTSTSVPNGTSVTLTPTFSANGGATISSASIDKGVGTVTSEVGVSATPTSSTTTTYTLTVTDSNSNTATAQVSVTAYVNTGSSPQISLNPSTIVLGNSSQVYASWTGNLGQSNVTANSSDSGLVGSWVPSATQGASISVTPTAVGTYTFTNTLNGSSPTATANLIVGKPNVATFQISQYYPASKTVKIYSDDDGTTFNKTLLKITAITLSGDVEVITPNWQYRLSLMSGSWGSLPAGSVINTTGLEPSISVLKEGYYRCIITNQFGAYVESVTSDSFEVTPRYRAKPIEKLVVIDILSISKSNPALITVKEGTPFLAGETVLLSGITGTGMTSLNNQNVTLNSTAILHTYSMSGVNTSSYGNYEGGGTLSYGFSLTSTSRMIDWIPISNVQAIDGDTRRITTSSSHGFSSGQRVTFTNIVGFEQLNSKLLSVDTIDETTFDVTTTVSGSYISGGYAIGADTAESTRVSNLHILTGLSSSSRDYYTNDTASEVIKFANINASAAKIFVRAGFTYTSLTGTDNVFPTHPSADNAPGAYQLQASLAINNLIRFSVFAPFSPTDGSSYSNGWSQSLVGSNYTGTFNGLTSLRDLSVTTTSFSSSFASSSAPSPENLPDGVSATLDVYDIYVVYVKSGSLDEYSGDTVFPVSELAPLPSLPGIYSFTASKITPNPGETIQLTGIFYNGVGTVSTYVSGNLIETQNIYNNSSLEVTPYEETTYTLTVTKTVIGDPSSPYTVTKSVVVYGSSS